MSRASSALVETLRHGNVLENRPQRVDQIAGIAARRMFVGANGHFFRAAATGNQSYAHFDQSHVGLRRGLNARRVQRNFASAAQRHAKRRGDHRAWRVLDGHVHALELAHRHMQVIPFAFLRADQHHHQIGAH